jgi:hypothetical protein
MPFSSFDQNTVFMTKQTTFRGSKSVSKLQTNQKIINLHLIHKATHDDNIYIELRNYLTFKSVQYQELLQFIISLTFQNLHN